MVCQSVILFYLIFTIILEWIYHLQIKSSEGLTSHIITNRQNSHLSLIIFHSKESSLFMPFVMNGKPLDMYVLDQ